MEKYSRELEIIYTPEPTKENIEYAFQRFITPIAIASSFEPYKESWSNLEDVLKVVEKWAICYEQTKTLTFLIDSKEVELVDKLLYDLDGKYLDAKGLYIEDAYNWFLQLKVLVEKTKGKENKSVR